MIDIAKGRYWDLSLTLVSGCTPCSPGCDHCWALAMEKRFSNKLNLMNGAIYTHLDRLTIPLQRRKPTVYSVWNDLMHESVPDSFIGKALSSILGLPRHTFLILTKRAERMSDIMTRFYAIAAAKGLCEHDHIWHGLTVCNQQEADEKIPFFLRFPGKKFLSIEPMLGPIDLTDLEVPREFDELDHTGGIFPSKFNSLTTQYDDVHYYSPPSAIDAVIIGGETGPGARPMHPDWVGSIRDQCKEAGVAFFFKQWGEYAPSPDGGLSDDLPAWKGYYFEEPYEQEKVWRFGRSRSGRRLDGQEYNDLPWVKG